MIFKDTVLMKTKYEDTFKRNGFNQYSDKNNAIAFWSEMFNPNGSFTSMTTAMHKDTKEYIKFRSKIDCDCLSFDQMLDNIWRVLNRKASLQNSNNLPRGIGCN